ncbi:MAG: glycoside hydrolase family 13 protein [Melioribacteraceae bacterium]|nr:glycoside hydrolase family 13 protein [Melioribacteraceae bacterium]
MKNFLIAIITIVLTATCTNKSGSEDRVPQWAKEVVWYQIFPERFNNGDPNNDPQVEDVIKGWPFIEPDEWQVHPWTSDWFKRQPWEEKFGNYNFYQIQGMRRYGGDLQGVIDKLDYLEELGVNALYFNPLFEAPSLHKYDATLYRHIDNNFGPDPEGDVILWESENPVDPETWRWTSADSLFLNLIKKCHDRGIKVIIDGVFNHVGIHFWTFKDIVENQQKSQFKDWIEVTSWDNPSTTANEFDYKGWIGIKDLPELKEDSTGLIEPIKNHVFNIVKRWMDPDNDGDPSDGIDGWRLDVAEMVNIGFWKEFRTYVKSINPEAYITGEIWWEDWQNNKMFNAAPWLQGDAFDAVMNYRFARAVRHYILRTEKKITAGEFVDSLNQIYKDYNKENVYVLMNLMDSHDVDRLASQVVNPDLWYDHNANPAQNENYIVEAPDYTGRMKQRLVAGLQMTLPGAPMIYYGDEAGMWGGDDPDCRKPMVWAEFNYEDETAHPLGNYRSPDKVSFDENLFAWYKKMIDIRKSNRVLGTGDIEFYSLSDNVLLFKRFNNENEIIVIVNSSGQNENIRLNQIRAIEISEGFDLVSGSKIKTDLIRIDPYQIIILKNQKAK